MSAFLQSSFVAAVAALRPGVNFADRDGTLAGIRWDAPLPDGFTPPLQSEIDAMMATLDARAARRAAYPARETFDSTQDWIDACDAVNAQHPLPE